MLYKFTVLKQCKSHQFIKAETMSRSDWLPWLGNGVSNEMIYSAAIYICTEFWGDYLSQFLLLVRNQDLCICPIYNIIGLGFKNQW